VISTLEKVNFRFKGTVTGEPVDGVLPLLPGVVTLVGVLPLLFGVLLAELGVFCCPLALFPF
jgi:hypothetical protein